MATTAEAEITELDNGVDYGLARKAWDRYVYCDQTRGHADYCRAAFALDGFYLGGGRHWTDEERQAIDDGLCLEFNEIMPSINAAIGYQIANRLDISYRPRGGNADQQIAEALSKVVMQIADRNQLRWKETDVFADGLIQRRGYFRLGMDYSDNIEGEIRITAVDPMDCIPDPDAKGYDPDTWADRIVLSWATLDEIESLWGPEARKSAENDAYNNESDFGDNDPGAPRNKFGGSLWTTYGGEGEERVVRVRVIDWQRNVYTMCHVELSPEGDVRTLMDSEVPQALARGANIVRRMARKVRWTVSTYSHVLHDDWSNMRHLDIVPYFAFFRRGETRGLVDPAVDPQRVLNKAICQFVRILGTAANSGWKIEQDSLSNMTTDELKERGGENGLVLEYVQGSRDPQKIEPTSVPTGIDKIIDRAQAAIRDVTTPEAMRGLQSQELTGIAIQSRQFAAQQQLAVPLDNLGRTRHILASRILEMVQDHYIGPRIFRITEIDSMGREIIVQLPVNQFQNGQWLNDLTIGTYDVVISEQPQQVTFENTQFTQALELRKVGISIPDSVVVRHSNLADKEDILDDMERQSSVDPMAEAKTALLKAQVEKAKADTVARAVESEYSAIQTAAVIANIPQTAPTADAILASAGFVDRNGPPIAPPAQMAPTPQLPQNTSPMYPANPDVGINSGIETLATP